MKRAFRNLLIVMAGSVIAALTVAALGGPFWLSQVAALAWGVLCPVHIFERKS